MRVNPALCEMLGYGERGLVGSQFLSIVHPGDQTKATEHHRQLLAGVSSNLVTEKRYVSKSGKVFWVQVSVSMIRDHEGRPARFLTLVEDISARKKVERDLRESEEHYRLLFDANPSPILLVDIESHRIVGANAAAVRHYGYAPDELVGMSADRLRPPEELPRFTAILERLGRGEYLVTDSRHFRKDGSGLDAEITCRPVLYDGRKVSIAVVRDLTERRRAEQLECERQSLRTAVSSMEQVLAVVGHELRTPLAGLMAMCDFLSSPEPRGSPEFDKFPRAIGDEASRMSNTVDHLLEAARLNSGRARWNWACFEIAGVCRDAVETIRHLVDADRVVVTLRLDPAVAPVLGDAGAVRRLLLNLLSNARKHTADGGIDVSVSASEEGGARWTRIEVRDTGSGIPPEMLGRLGEAFALNSGVVGTHYVSGAGLGVAICRGIAMAAASGSSLRPERERR